jgi:hypothetical protein
MLLLSSFLSIRKWGFSLIFNLLYSLCFILYAFKPATNEIQTIVPPPLHPRLYPFRNTRAIRNAGNDGNLCPCIHRLRMAGK